MDYLPLLLQQEANKMYPNILNCVPGNPPQRPGRVPHSFFLKERGGLGLNLDFGGDEVLDYARYNSSEYALVKDGVNLKLMKDGSTTTLATQTYGASKYHSFKTLSSVGGTLSESGTNATGSTGGGEFYLTDVTKAWVVNAYAGQFVYVYAATAGAGQIFKIKSNDATALTLESGYDVAPTAASYKIFDTYTEVLAFVGGDGIYIIHNDTNIIKVQDFGAVIDFEYNSGRIFALDTNYNVLCSATASSSGGTAMGGGYFATYVNNYSLLGTALGAFRVITFKDSVLILSDINIKIVKELSADVSGTTITSYIINTITSFVGAHSKDAIRVFNQGLYMLSSNNKFVSVSISEVGEGKYNVKLDDMGTNIQQWLDSISSSDTVSIDMTDDTIILVRYDVSDTQSYIFKFDQYYQFWYRWETELDIRRVKVFINPYYLGDLTYIYNNDLASDYGSNTFTQTIKLFVGEEDIFSLKQYNSHSLYLGKNTSLNTTVTYTAYIDGKNYTVTYPLAQCEYLQTATALASTSVLGSTILGLGMFGGDTDSDYVSSLFVSDINVIELPIAITVSLMEINITGSFEIGGMILGYNKFEPHITPINSVVGYGT